MKQSSKVLEFSKITIDHTLNGRKFIKGSEDSSYDLPAMMNQVKESRRILQPIGVEKTAEGYRVIDGFRRATAVSELLEQKDLPSDIRDNLTKMTFIVYEDLSEDERNGILFNQGSQKGLTRIETIELVWRLAAGGCTFKAICVQLWQQLILLSSSGDQDNLKKKLAEATTDADKATVLSGFFTGRVKNYYIDGYFMGDRIRRAIIETESGRTPEFKTSQARIVKLNKAKTADNGIWTAKDGSPAFNTEIEKFIKEDKDGKEKVKDTRASKDDMVKWFDNAKSATQKNAFLMAQGVNCPNNMEVDSNGAALEDIQAFIRTQLDALKTIVTPSVFAVVMQVAYPNGSADGFKAAFDAAIAAK